MTAQTRGATEDKTGAHRVALMGGLGNQLFQYAFGQWIQSASRWAVDFDYAEGSKPSSLMSLLPGVSLTERGWRRGLGPIARFQAFSDGVRRLQGYETVRDLSLRGSVRGDLLTRKTYWCGYWQQPYFADQVPDIVAALRDGLAQHNSLLREARSRSPGAPVIAVHVRRGDYAGVTPLLTPEYFGRAYRVVANRLGVNADDTQAIVVSDEPSWAQENISLPGTPSICRDDSSALQDMACLAYADGAVISHSTFSWWAARLRQGKAGTVAAPTPWRLGNQMDDTGRDFRLDGWNAVSAEYSS